MPCRPGGWTKRPGWRIWLGAALGASVLLVAQSGFGLEEIKAMLYGDLIVSSPRDRWVLLLTGVPSLAICAPGAYFNSSP